MFSWLRLDCLLFNSLKYKLKKIALEEFWLECTSKFSTYLYFIIALYVCVVLGYIRGSGNGTSQT